MVFRMPGARQRKSLAKAVIQYRNNLTLADGFLKDRGIPHEVADSRMLGVVDSPLPSHEQYQGRLCIPYLNKAGPIAVTFRCLRDHACGEVNCKKYLQPAGQTQFLYNVCDLDSNARTVHVTEGELDCIVLSMVLGEPAVGASGRDKWQPHWVAHFTGWDRVLVWSDGDKAGRDMALDWQRRVGAEIVHLPKGHDVSSLCVEEGPEALLKLAGGDEDAEISGAYLPG